MKPKLLLPAILFFLLFTACDDNDGPDFDYPTLTKDNTVGFTVRTTHARTVELVMSGNKIAIDWGDGNVEGYNHEYMGSVTHTYRESGSFDVKIWSENLVEMSVSGLVQPLYSLHIGYCPSLVALNINSFPDVESLVLDNCPKLQNLAIGNFESLESVELSGCPKLDILYCYTTEKLTSLDLSANDLLRQLTLSYTGLTFLGLEYNNQLSSVRCYNSKLESIRVSEQNQITSLDCTMNEMELLDLSEFPNLSSLDCSGNKLTSLDLTACTGINWVNCYDNELTEIVLPADNYVYTFWCYDNKLSADMLNRLFADLPESPDKYPGKELAIPSGRYARIQFTDNPGTADCDTGIIRDKGWMILESGTN